MGARGGDRGRRFWCRDPVVIAPAVIGTCFPLIGHHNTDIANGDCDNTGTISTLHSSWMLMMQDPSYAYPGNNFFEACPNTFYATLAAFANWPVPLELNIAMIPKLP